MTTCTRPAQDVENCKRVQVKLQSGDNCYLLIGDKSLMASFANESGYEGCESKSLLNFSCRMVSKYLSMGGSWDDVVKQAEGSGVGYRTVVSEIAKAVNCATI